MSESFLLTKIKKWSGKVSTKWKPEWFKEGKNWAMLNERVFSIKTCSLSHIYKVS